MRNNRLGQGSTQIEREGGSSITSAIRRLAWLKELDQSRIFVGGLPGRVAF